MVLLAEEIMLQRLTGARAQILAHSLTGKLQIHLTLWLLQRELNPSGLFFTRLNFILNQHYCKLTRQIFKLQSVFMVLSKYLNFVEANAAHLTADIHIYERSLCSLACCIFSNKPKKGSTEPQTFISNYMWQTRRNRYIYIGIQNAN